MRRSVRVPTDGAADLSVSLDSVRADSSSRILADADAFAEGSALLPSGQRAAELLALAERLVRWEDDVSPAELRLFERMYVEVLLKAKLELAGTAESHAFESLISSADGAAICPRTALLRLRADVCALVVRAEQARRLAHPTRRKHWTRYVFGLLAIIVIGAFAARDLLADALNWGNVSHGRRWVASSTYASHVPVSGVLNNFSDPFFFHTAYEDSPWIEVDLGVTTPARSMKVVNRTDCCATRAVPMTVETSLDHRTWRTAASRRTSFSRWRVRLTQPTRWVRVRALRETHLHLKAIVIRK
jgi:hypothetical protein